MHRFICYILFFVLLNFQNYAIVQEIASYDNKFKFIENKGQWPDFVLYKASANGSKMYLEQGRILYQFMDTDALHHHHAQLNKADKTPEIKQELITANFIDANPIRNTAQKFPSEEYYNFFIGNDKSKWASNVYGYSDVVLEGIYDSIDLHFNNQGDHLKYEFIVKKFANPNDIKISYENAKSIKITRKGNLRIEGELGIIEEKKPYVYQVKNGKIVEIRCNYKVKDNMVSYELDTYDNTLDLIIDPDLIFASYSGSASDNFGMTATYDHHGNLYSGGTVFGNAYPTTAGAYDEEGNLTNLMPVANDTNGTYGVTDIFISKYNSEGTTMIYSTYIGGGDDDGGTEVPHSLICNEDNELYFFGTTSSDDFPLVNAYQTVFNGGLYRRFDSNGARFWGSDGTKENGGTDLIIGKFSEDGSELLGSTYLGGSENDGLNYNETGDENGNVYGGLMFNYGDPFRGEIMLDAESNCYVISSTYSNDFPIVNGFQPDYGGEQDGIVAKFNPDLSDLIWSTYIGGGDRDACYSIEFDSESNIYVSGGTKSSDFSTTAGAIQETHNNPASADGFLVKISPDGQNLINSTFIGTEEYDQVYFIQINRHDDLFLLGQTEGEITPSPDTYNNPNSGQFIMKVENDFSEIVFQTIFGNGNGLVNISPTAFLVDICGNIYVSGWGGGIAGSLHQLTALDDMPVTADAFQSEPPNGYDFYLIVLSSEAKELVYGSYLGGDKASEHVDGGTSRFDEDGVVYHSGCGGCGGHSDFPTFPDDVWSSTNESGNCNNLVFKFNFDLIPRANAYAEEYIVCTNHEIQLNNESENFISFEWDFGNGETSTTSLNPTVMYEDTGTYEITLIVFDSLCGLSDTTSFEVEVIREIELDSLEDVYQCEPSLITLTGNSFGTASEFIWSSNPGFSDTLNSSTSDSIVEIFSEDGGYFYLKAFNDYCEKVDSLLIFYTSSSMKLEGDTKLCIGDSATVRAINTNDTISFDSFIWQPNSIITDGQGESEVTIYTLSSGYVKVTADASNGCIISDSILIEVSDIDTLEIEATASEYLIPINSTVTLSANPSGYNYSWSPEVGVQDPNAQQTVATLGENTLFTVTITDSICFLEDTVMVSVFDYVCDEPNLFIPNAFTPNDDGNNDVLYVRSRIIDDTRNFVFRVFNRWGEMVFETHDINEGWDGDWKDKRSKPDVYDYYLEGYCIDGQPFLIQGNVTLIR